MSRWPLILFRPVAPLLLLAASVSCTHRATPGEPADELQRGRVNAVLVEERVLPSYPVEDAAARNRSVAFQLSGSRLIARAEDGRSLWETEVGDAAAHPFGTFDLDGDGWPDLGLARHREGISTCGDRTAGASWLDFVDGRTGVLLRQVTRPQADICWTFGSTTYPTAQWAAASVIWGSPAGVVSLQEYYAEHGLVLEHDGTGLSQRSRYVFPSVPAFGEAYPTAAAVGRDGGGGGKHVPNSHVAMGFLIGDRDEPQLVFFTNGRVVAFSVGADPAEVLFDRPFGPSDRADIARRNKGLVVLDLRSPLAIWLLAGGDTRSVYCDMFSRTPSTDPWACIERHVTRWEIGGPAVDQRFFSYAHDNAGAARYEGRLVHVAGALLTAAEGGGSHAVYNLFTGGHWQVHVTTSGATRDLRVFEDMFLWDARDLEGDGSLEMVLSPVSRTEAPPGFEYYFPAWRTEVHAWDEATHTLRLRWAHDGAIPELVPSLSAPRRYARTYYSQLFPVLTVAREGQVEVVLRSRSGLVLVDADGRLTASIPSAPNLASTCALPE